MTSQAGKTEQGGFVFAELLVVIAIIAAVLALAAPALRGTWNETNFNAAVREFSARLSDARMQSVSREKKARISIDLRRNRYLLEIEQDNGEFSAPKSSLDKPRSLPKDTHFLSVEGPDILPAASDAYVVFSPDGTATERKIIIKDKNGKAFEIKVHPATGSVSTKSI